MTPDVYAEMGADGIEGTPRIEVCSRDAGYPCLKFNPGWTAPESIFYIAALDAAGTCAVPSVRWSGWAIFTEDGDLDYYAYATNAETAIAIARDAGCEGDIYAIEDGDGVGTCQEVA